MVAAPKGLFPPDPEPYTGPKLKVAIIGAGLAGMSTAVELLEQGHEVIFVNCNQSYHNFRQSFRSNIAMYRERNWTLFGMIRF